MYSSEIRESLAQCWFNVLAQGKPLTLPVETAGVDNTLSGFQAVGKSIPLVVSLL